MTTTFRPQKALFLAVFALTLTFPNLSARAQVASEPATQAQVQELQNTLVALLTQLIAQLQAQINDLLAQQAAQATQLGVVQSQVNTVVSQTAPAPVVVPTPVPPPPPPTPLTFSAKAPLGDFCMVKGEGKGSKSDEYSFHIGLIDVVGLTATGTTASDVGRITVQAEVPNGAAFVYSAGNLFVSFGQYTNEESGRSGLYNTGFYVLASDVRSPGTFRVTIQGYIPDNGRQISGLPITITRTAKWCQ